MEFKRAFLTALILFAGIATITSCKKSATPAPGAVTKFTDIKASNTFSWATTQKINFFVTGLAIGTNESNMLKVFSTDGKVLYYSQFVAMHTSIATSFLVPAGTSTLLVTYGTISKSVTVVNNIASFNYTQDLVD